MWLDTMPDSNPQGTTRLNKNIVFSKGGKLENEKGTIVIESYGENKSSIGFIYLDSDEILLCVRYIKDNINYDEFGIVGTNNKYRVVYQTLASNGNTIGLLDFDLSYPIHGIQRKNEKGERIIAWTNQKSSLKYFNLDNIPENLTSKLLETNVTFIAPNITTSIELGGSLSAGAYYIILQYERKDGAKSSWIKHYNPIFIVDDTKSFGLFVDGAVPGTRTNKQIKIILNSFDQDFVKLNIGYVQSVDGVLTAYKTGSVGSKTRLGFSAYITGSEIKTAIALDEVIVDKQVFKKVEHITSLQNTVYVGNVTLFNEGNPQPIINTLGQYLSWYSERVDLLNEPGTARVAADASSKSHRYNNERRSFAHGEVYALFISILYPWGYGTWRPLIGREGTRTEKAIIDGDASLFLEETYKRFQLEDTCSVTSKTSTSANGTFSFWENETENYPNIQYPNGNVRHFKFPSMKFMRDNVYDNRYGTSYSDILGIKCNIPDNVISSIVDADGNKAIGYRIGYAKRTIDNATNIGQSIYTGVIENVSDKKFYSFGSNYGRYNVGQGKADILKKDKIRVYPFEQLFERRLIRPNFIRVEYKIRNSIPAFVGGSESKQGIVVDFIQNAETESSTQPFIKVTDSDYLIYNTIHNNHVNTFLEEAIVLDLVEPIKDYVTIEKKQKEYSLFEETALITMLSIKRTMYAQFWNYSIVDTGYQGGDIIWGGDVYICDYSINQFSRITDSLTYSNDIEDKNNANTIINGNRYAKRFIVESMYNIGFRYISDTKELGYTEYYPKRLTPYDKGGYLLEMKRDLLANAFINGYSRDYHAQNVLTARFAYNPTKDYQFFLERIYRGIDINPDSELSDWLNFRINDYYEINKSRGKLVNLIAYQDGLLFHHTDSLYKTRTRSYIDTTDGAAFVGYGNLFEYDPVEVAHSVYGQMGTQHKWSCNITPIGYMFLDANAKRFYIYSGDSRKVLSDEGLVNFFNDYSESDLDNPFMSFGFLSAFDEQFNRLLLVKNIKELTEENKNKFKGIWKDSPNFVNSLKVGDIIIKDNKYVKVKEL